MTHDPVSAAVEAIDAFLGGQLNHVREDAPPLDGTVHLHTTDDGDVHGEWLVRVGDDGRYVVTREHAKGSCALRGAAADLLEVLWRRRPLASIDVVGDIGVAERFVARTRLG
jgi:hypothetical protein